MDNEIKLLRERMWIHPLCVLHLKNIHHCDVWFWMSTWHKVESLGKGASPKKCLDYIGPWPHLGVTFLIRLIKVWRLAPNVGGSISGLGAGPNKRKEFLSSSIHELIHCPLLLTMNVIWLTASSSCCLDLFTMIKCNPGRKSNKPFLP